MSVLVSQLVLISLISRSGRGDDGGSGAGDDGGGGVDGGSGDDGGSGGGSGAGDDGGGVVVGGSGDDYACNADKASFLVFLEHHTGIYEGHVIC